jgi:hypothetical protein
MTCGSGTAGFPTADQAKQMSRNYAVIWAEIAAIQGAILKATSGCMCVDGNPVNRGGKFCVIVNDNTPMTENVGLKSITVTAPGVDYFPITASVTFNHPTGTGATGTVTVLPSGTIVNVPITNGGAGYQTLHATTVLPAVGAGGDVTITVDAVTGEVVSATIVNSGFNYLFNDVIAVLPATGTTGTGADIRITGVGSLGEITAVSIVSGGTGYFSVSATAAITHPVGVGFNGVVLVNASGAITGVSIQDGGILYGPLLPNVFIDDVTGNGAGATAYPTIDAITGGITAVILINKGANYSTDTIAEIIPAPTSTGTGATLSVQVSPNIFGTDPYLYYLSLTDQLDSCAIKDQIEQVINYFTQLGYMIEAQVNPNTNSTIQWEICWC